MIAIVILAVLLGALGFIFLLACYAFTPPDAGNKK